MRAWIAAISVGLSALAATTAVAGQAPNAAQPYDLSHAKSYSSICLYAPTGDMLGMRVFVRAKGEVPRVLVQLAEGELGKVQPAVTRTLSGQLGFDLPTKFPETSYSGEIGERYAIVHSHAEGAKPFRLRLRDDSQGFPDCRANDPNDGAPSSSP